MTVCVLFIVCRVWMLLSCQAVMQQQCDWPPLSCPLTFNTHSSPSFSRAHPTPEPLNLPWWVFFCFVCLFVYVRLLYVYLHMEQFQHVTRNVRLWLCEVTVSHLMYVWEKHVCLADWQQSSRWDRRCGWVCLLQCVLPVKVTVLFFRVRDWN